MATYYVDDGGDNSNGQSWVSAYTSVNSLDTAVALANGDVVYFGSDHQCQATNSADLTIVGPTSGNPVSFISSTVDLTGAATGVSYVSGSGSQIDTTEGTYSVILDGSFALYGIKIVSGADIELKSDYNEIQQHKECSFVLGDDGVLYPGTGTTNGPKVEIIDSRIDTLADTGTPINNIIETNGICDFRLCGCDFGANSLRADSVIRVGTVNATAEVVGCDMSGLTNVSRVFTIPAGTQSIHLAQCSIPSGVTMFYDAGSAAYPAFEFLATDTNNNPTYTYCKKSFGIIDSSTTEYRTSGAQIAGTSFSWRVNSTTSSCGRGSEFYSPWIYGYISTTGTKTFSLHITNDLKDFTNSEVWLEVQTKTIASSSTWQTVSDEQFAPDNATAQTDDTGSTWAAGGTYSQTLSVGSVAVNTVGLYRARVCIAYPSIVVGNYFYIDPQVTVY